MSADENFIRISESLAGDAPETFELDDPYGVLDRVAEQRVLRFGSQESLDTFLEVAEAKQPSDIDNQHPVYGLTPGMYMVWGVPLVVEGTAADRYWSCRAQVLDCEVEP